MFIATEVQVAEIRTLGELEASGWKSRSVKQEMRENLVRKLQTGASLFDGIFGYEKTVIPQLVDAILARHDLLLLGLRGQAKTRMLRSLPQFLDPWMPVLDGAPLNDDPFHPVSRFGRDIVVAKGKAAPVRWIPAAERYVEKLATPDTTVADLIGDIDPIKAATRKLDLADEQVIHFGLIPRANRCIFVINELPDLQPRIQVALLNIMQERDIQIRGFNIRMPLDVAIHFSANPEDYTNRGSIITPLKDRIDAQIITHYPKTIDTGVRITAHEAWVVRGGPQVEVPHLLAEAVEQVAAAARVSEFVDQKSGVSARLTIACMEYVISTAERRAIRNGQERTTARLSDLYQALPALTGKMELVYEGEQEGPANVAIHLIGKAMAALFEQYYPRPVKRTKSGASDPYAPVTGWFRAGHSIQLSPAMADAEYQAVLNSVPGLAQAAKAGAIAAPEAIHMELLLEGLHQASMLSREFSEAGTGYGDMAGSVLGNILSGSDEQLDS